MAGYIGANIVSSEHLQSQGRRGAVVVTVTGWLYCESLHLQMRIVRKSDHAVTRRWGKSH